MGAVADHEEFQRRVALRAAVRAVAFRDEADPTPPGGITETMLRNTTLMSGPQRTAWNAHVRLVERRHWRRVLAERILRGDGLLHRFFLRMEAALGGVTVGGDGSLQGFAPGDADAALDAQWQAASEEL